MDLTSRDERLFNRRVREYMKKLEEIHFENREEVAALLAVSEIIVKKLSRVRVERVKH